ncbi:MAG TPA: VWA domain-containing protein [Pyrinomonadaceae bacterium]|nr:VWA domain-containing protein [Pyrinomonadaceae bacterium]
MTKLLGLVFLVIVQFGFPIYSSAQNKDDDIISVDSSIVVMNAAVTDASGKGVRGLNAKLFHIFEDGQEQEIKSFEAEETPFAAVILLDTSGSMEERVSLARSAAIQFLDGMRADDFTAIYKFDSKIEMLQDFSNSRDMSDHVYEIKADGMTVLNDAVFKAAELLSKRPEKRRAIIVLSDGADTMSKATAEKALRAALLANANIYSVDMSALDTGGKERMQTQGVLKNFAEKTGGRFITTSGGIAMRDAFKRIVEELGGQYTIAYQPANTAKDGKWRSIELRISRPNLTIRTRKGYNAPKQK